MIGPKPERAALGIFLAILLGGVGVIGAACSIAPLTPPDPYITPNAPQGVLPTAPTQLETPSPTQLILEAPAPTPIRASMPPPTIESTFPTRLLIPKLQVDEAIVEVPIVNGEWDISGLGAQVGWLTTTGSEPGAEWAMAFVGHVSLDTGVSGPFGYLWQLRPGAEIILQTEQAQYVYALTEKREVGVEAVKDLYVADGHQIVLMTCDNWDFANWRYTERLLALAELVEQRP